jgi:hypothetical protein
VVATIIVTACPALGPFRAACAETNHHEAGSRSLLIRRLSPTFDAVAPDERSRKQADDVNRSLAKAADQVADKPSLRRSDALILLLSERLFAGRTWNLEHSDDREMSVALSMVAYDPKFSASFRKPEFRTGESGILSAASLLLWTRRAISSADSELLEALDQVRLLAPGTALELDALDRAARMALAAKRSEQVLSILVRHAHRRKSLFVDYGTFRPHLSALVQNLSSKDASSLRTAMEDGRFQTSVGVRLLVTFMDELFLSGKLDLADVVLAGLSAYPVISPWHKQAIEIYQGVAKTSVLEVGAENYISPRIGEFPSLELSKQLLRVAQFRSRNQLVEPLPLLPVSALGGLSVRDMVSRSRLTAAGALSVSDDLLRKSNDD